MSLSAIMSLASSSFPGPAIGSYRCLEERERRFTTLEHNLPDHLVKCQKQVNIANKTDCETTFGTLWGLLTPELTVWGVPQWLSVHTQYHILFSQDQQTSSWLEDKSDVVVETLAQDQPVSLERKISQSNVITKKIFYIKQKNPINTLFTHSPPPCYPLTFQHVLLCAFWLLVRTSRGLSGIPRLKCFQEKVNMRM